MNERRVQAYVSLTCVAAVGSLVIMDWGAILALPGRALLGLGGLVAIAIVSESMALGLTLAGRGGGRSTSITFLPMLASAQLFGPAAAVLLIVPTLSLAELFVRKKPPIRVVFNVAQAVVAVTVAGWLFVLAGGLPLSGGNEVDIGGQLLPFILFGLIFLVMNHAAVSLAVALNQQLPFRRVLREALRNSGGSLQDILISPVALAFAFLYVQYGLGGILVALMPMLFIRYSYSTTAQLQDSNSDLLTALVKAIEVRDPYTSGHSQRVSELASDIAESMGLSRARIERVGNAALLHDIGKIEAVYTDILRKPDSLTAEERAVIESHVTKGVQFLLDMSSVHEEVIQAVRHHHEREDGKGYPDGLLGDEIPIGAKIIIVCDSVDAMLSDRPYRKALSLPVVMEELEKHRGQQFDHRVVRALLRSDILPTYAEKMRAFRAETASEDELDLEAVVSPPLVERPPQPARARRQLFLH